MRSQHHFPLDRVIAARIFCALSLGIFSNACGSSSGGVASDGSGGSAGAEVSASGNASGSPTAGRSAATDAGGGGSTGADGSAGGATGGTGTDSPDSGAAGSGAPSGAAGSGTAGGSSSTGGSTSAGGSAGAGGIVSAAGFVHPGVLLNRGMLDFVKGKLASAAEPWQTAFKSLQGNRAASLTYTAHAVASVDCGPYSKPDVGCTDETNDADAAYADALIWYYTGDTAHAQKAVEILDAWSAVLKQHTNSNARLQAGWAAEVFVRAAEIMRYTYPAWPAASSARFGSMLKTAYLPNVSSSVGGDGNWDLTMTDALINIGVYNDDRATFDAGVKRWRARTPAYIYLTTDGPTPVKNPMGGQDWHKPTAYIDGLGQETCRDVATLGNPGFGHFHYGLAAMINAAETAGIQGVDLFTGEQKRIAAGLELHAKYLKLGNADALCNAPLQRLERGPTYEIGYNALANIRGLSLPNTLALLPTIRPTGSNRPYAWETLTHANIGKAGTP